MPKSGVLVLMVAEGGTLSPIAETLDDATKGLLRRAMSKASFEGKKDQTLELVLPEGAGPDGCCCSGLAIPRS